MLEGLEDAFHGAKCKGIEHSSHFCLEKTGARTLKCLVTLKDYFFQAVVIILVIQIVLELILLSQVGYDGDPVVK